MAISWDSFDKIWASTSPLTPYSFSDPNYAQGWNFVGSTPPARQMWDSIQKQNDEKFKYLRDNFGTPNIVTQASQMTDTEKVYVYMGSEAGWNSGHWYYYDEGTSSWADGGVYNSVAFVTDTTLSIAGQPADAKATGDALALKSDLAGCTFTGNVSVNADLSVTGDATIGTDLSVTGVSTLTGNVSAGADVTVVGDVSSANMTTSADATIGGDLSVTGASTLADTTVNDLDVNNDLSVAGDSSLTNLSVSGTTALAGTSTAPTPSADDNSTKIATTEYVQTELKPIETKATIDDKRISNIEKLLQGNLYDYQTDSNSAYTKTVPAGAMPYAGLERVGGKTLVWNNIAQFKDMTAGILTVSSDGSIVANGTQERTQSTGAITNAIPLYSSHKYLFKMTLTSGTISNSGNINLHMDGWNVSKTVSEANPVQSVIYQPSADSLTADIKAQMFAGTTYNCTIHCFVTDLTLLYGAGNEPSTVEEFEAMFPASYYAYNAGTLLSAGVTEVVSKKADTTTIATYPIPAEIQSLDGYGWSAGTAYNYIDYERKVFVQNVGKIVYDGNETWRLSGTNVFYHIQSGVDDSQVKSNANIGSTTIICDKYAFCGAYTPNSDSDKTLTIGYYTAVNTFNVSIHDSAYVVEGDSAQSITNFKTFLSGNNLVLYYPLATPIETDISAYLSDDNLIEVEAGGTLTFPNSNGDNYRIPVPSTQEYMINLQEAVSNG